MKKVFISYSSIDRSAAFEIMELLQQHGCDVWLDFFDIKPTEVLQQELTGNLKKADTVCVLLSPSSVDSKWVAFEIELALEIMKAGRLRVLPVILRPCKIPDRLNLIGVDVMDGVPDEAVALRLVRAVLGEEQADDAVLLSAGKRQELAKRQMREEAEGELPRVARELNRIRKKPIREVAVDIDEDTFPRETRTILELRLTLDSLFSAPMSFYFAQYREGATWPEEFGFDEPPYTDYFKTSRPRIDCKFTWFDRTEQMSQTIDGTDLQELPATFTLEFDGKRFKPGGPGIHLPQKFEIPSLQALFDKNSSFELIAHHPDEKSAENVDLKATDIDISVTAGFRGFEPNSCRLFHSRHNTNQRVVLSSKYLSDIESEIEREALLDLYPVPSEVRDPNRRQRVIAAVEADAEINEQDRRFAATFCVGDGRVTSFRGDHFTALKRFERAATLLQPVVLDGYPTYKEGLLMYQACANLVGYFMQRKEYARAADFVNGVGLVAQRLVSLDPNEPDYRRLWAEALLTNAIVHAKNGDTATARDELVESVGMWKKLSEELQSPERLIDARKAFADGIGLAKDWGIEDQLPLDVWAKESGAKTTTAVRNQSR